MGRAEVTTTGFLALCFWISRATALSRSKDPMEPASNFITIMSVSLVPRAGEAGLSNAPTRKYKSVVRMHGMTGRHRDGIRR